MTEVTSTESNVETTDSSPSGVEPGINPAYAEEAPKAEKTAEQKEAAAALRKLKFKNREVEVDDAKYHEYAQKGLASTETWQEAAKMKREAEQFIHRLKNDPRSVLTDPTLGVDFRKIAEEYVWEQIQEEQLSPEQKQARDMDRELKKYREQEEKAKVSEKEQKAQQLREHYSTDYDKRISQALSTSGLPKTEGTVKRMIEYMLHDVNNGFQRDASDYVEYVRQDYMRDIQELFGQTDGDTLMKFLGEDTMKKAREADLKRLKTTTPESGHTFVPGKGMVKAKAQKKLSGLDWERSVMKDFKGF